MARIHIWLLSAFLCNGGPKPLTKLFSLPPLYPHCDNPLKLVLLESDYPQVTQGGASKAQRRFELESPRVPSFNARPTPHSHSEYGAERS